MKIEQTFQLYFSPTGGTQKAVEAVGGAWQDSVDIDLSVYQGEYEKYHFKSSDLCIIGVPSFGGRVPAQALENLSAVQGELTPAVLVVSYGNRAYEDTLLELKDTVEAHGFLCVAAVAAVTEHSIARQYGAGRPDKDDETMLRGYGRQIREMLKNAEDITGVNVPGNRPYREFGGVPVRPKASGRCTGCGVCVKRCPVGAISRENPRATDKERCISCMRCIMVCPQKARQCSPLMLAAVSKKLKKVCGGRKENELFIDSRP